MKPTKEILITAFALFSLFFGAGNLILPPQLGFKAGGLWWLVTLGFLVSAVLIPLLGILAHARLQGTMFDFGKKISPGFSLVYCFLVYGISIALPSPRTASVTHEMAIAPHFNSSPLLTSLGYFLLVFLFTLNRSQILDLVGKWLTPAIALILLFIIGLSWTTFNSGFMPTEQRGSFTRGILEGYQTFDAIGALVVGGVILVSINLKHGGDTHLARKTLITRAAFLAGACLLMVYAGLIYSGALAMQAFDPEISRTGLLQGIGAMTLGTYANAFLSILISLACFTTAVGIITGTADFVQSRFPQAPYVFPATTFGGCALGVVVGQFNADYIIDIALPALMFIYPITIVLILLNVVPEKLADTRVFRMVAITTLFFSIPDFLSAIGHGGILGNLTDWIPLSTFSMGWVLPALLVFLFCNGFLWIQRRR